MLTFIEGIMMPNREIKFYKKQNGYCPVKEFLLNMDDKTREKTVWVLKLIEDLPIIPTKYFKKMVNTSDIWECRINYNKNIYRLLGFFDDEKFVVLTHGFHKKTQKKPINEIEIAEKDYFIQKEII